MLLTLLKMATYRGTKGPWPLAKLMEWDKPLERLYRKIEKCVDGFPTHLLVNTYNHTVNRGIGYKPVDVTDAIENDIINKKKAQTGEISDKIFPDYQIGDKVRILRKKHTFEDKLMTKYHDIVVEVIKINNNILEVKDPDGNICHPKKIFCKKKIMSLFMK